jgi:hypothetical protein
VIKKRKRWKDKRRREERKKMRETVSDQIADQAAKPLKKGEKKKKKSPVLQQWNCSLSLSYITSLASRPVCVCLLGSFGALLWWVAFGWSLTGLQAEAFH